MQNKLQARTVCLCLLFLQTSASPNWFACGTKDKVDKMRLMSRLQLLRNFVEDCKCSPRIHLHPSWCEFLWTNHTRAAICKLFTSYEPKILFVLGFWALTWVLYGLLQPAIYSDMWATRKIQLQSLCIRLLRISQNIKTQGGITVYIKGTLTAVHTRGNPCSRHMVGRSTRQYS